MKICSVDGCTERYKSRGYCARHYQRHYERYGFPPRPTALERFWSMVDVRGPDDCWPCHSSRRQDQNTYARFYADGKLTTAHRWILGQTRGEPLRWDDDVREMACHTCDNRACVNPAHLYVGTAGTNQQDRWDRGHGRARKTHCLRGHFFDEANTVILKNGSRKCRACTQIHAARHREKQRRR